MESRGPSPFRPYYNPTTTSYLPGSAQVLEAPASTEYGYDFIDSQGWPTREALLAILQAQLTEYIGICIAQPFENAKILLQCQQIPKDVRLQNHNDAAEEDEDEEDPDYFGGDSTSQLNSERRITDRDGYVVQNDADHATRPAWQIAPKVPPSLGSTLDAIWSTEGLSGSLKATNLSFSYNFLREILEGQISGFLSVFVGIPDPILALETGDQMSLIVNLIAVGLTALLLAPIDIARTKIILTPLSEPRGIFHTLRSLPSRICPTSLIIPTLLERTLPTVLQHYLRSIFEPFSSICQLFVKLPLETILRRGQVSYSPPRKSVVHLGAYSGIGTIWWISNQEGDGVFGLYRGWKAGIVGVAGVWSLGLLAASQGKRTGTEF